MLDTLDFMTYVRETFICGLWLPRDWSVFRQGVTTNNDVKGCHRCLNGCRGSSHILMYILIPLLHKEAMKVNVEVCLVKDGRLAGYQEQTYQSFQGRFFTLRQRYENTRTHSNNC